MTIADTASCKVPKKEMRVLKKLYMLMVFAITAVAATVLIVAQAGANGSYVPSVASACSVLPCEVPTVAGP